MAGLIQYSTLVPAGKSVTLDVRGTAIIIRDLPGELEVTARSQRVGSQSGQAYKLTMRKFEKWFTAQEFDRVELRNNSEHDQFAELLIGYGDFVREVTSRSIAAQFFRTGVLSFDGSTEVAQQLVPENITRKRLFIASNFSEVGIGTEIDTEATAFKPWEGVGNNPAFELESTQAVWIFAPSGVAFDVYWLEEYYGA